MTRQDDLRAMVAAATPGPWHTASADHPSQGFFGCGFRLAEMVGGEIHRDRANSALAAQAPTLATELANALDLLAKRDAELARVKAAFRVNMLRYGPPGTSHAEIDAFLSAALTPELEGEKG